MTSTNTVVIATTGTLFGQSPARYGVASLIAAGLAFASWPLMIVFGFGMVYLAMLFALVAVVAGVLGVGSGIYFQGRLGIFGGLLGMLAIGLMALAAWYVAWSFTHF